MLSHKVLTRREIGRVANYYEDGADDYYAKDGKASEWQGKGAKILSLAGEVDSTILRKLLAGEVGTNDNTRLATRQDSHTRIGIDLTFSAPKSVSLQALLAGDERMIKAHDLAVKRAITLAERFAQARKKIKGKSQIETTANLVVAKFRHETSREKDPQLHTHAVVMNLTQRRDGQWRALKNDAIVKMTKYLGAVYRSELALELKKMGYNLRHEAGSMFELAHITREQIVGFSKRSNQVEELLAKRGLSRQTATTEQKQQATMQSRASKESISREVVFNSWQEYAKKLAINFDQKAWTRDNAHEIAIEQQAPERITRLEAAKLAVKFATRHLTEREAVISHSSLLDAAIKQAIGSARTSDIESAIKQQVTKGYLIKEAPLYCPADQINITQGKTKQEWRDELITKGMDKTKAREYIQRAITQGSLMQVETRYTTQAAITGEKQVLQIESNGRNMLAPIIKEEAAIKRLKATDLNHGQCRAAKLILTTQNRVVGVQGLAGTGKSHMLKTTIAIMASKGYQVQALAPYGSQVKALRELEVKANTLASFLRAKDKDIDSKTVLILDEAGVVPTKVMAQTLQRAERAGARVVLIGDSGQTKAIEAGRPFDQLQSAGMKTAYMDQIQRQENPTLKTAVELAAKGKTDKSLECVGSIIEIQDDKKRQATIANHYMQLSEPERERTLIVSGTNEARQSINQLVRQGLGTAEQGREFTALTARDTTGALRQFAKYYHIGDVIKAEKDYKKVGLQKGKLYEIADTGPGNRLTVKGESGENIKFNPIRCCKLAVYQQVKIELSVGDMVRVTCNDKQLDIVNGERLKVKEVEDKHVLLTDGKRTIRLDSGKPLHLDHAYATTVHSSQGLTADRVLIDASTRKSTTAQDVYYVAISRAKLEACIYTNNSKELPQAIARQNEKSAAFDIKTDKHQEYNRASKPCYDSANLLYQREERSR